MAFKKQRFFRPHFSTIRNNLCKKRKSPYLSAASLLFRLLPCMRKSRPKRMKPTLWKLLWLAKPHLANRSVRKKLPRKKWNGVRRPTVILPTYLKSTRMCAFPVSRTHRITVGKFRRAKCLSTVKNSITTITLSMACPITIILTRAVPQEIWQTNNLPEPIRTICQQGDAVFLD